jgi:methanogenic corrinoid protein MtbC1
MAHSAAEIGRQLDSMREALAEAAVDQQYLLHPELTARYGPTGRAKCVKDTAYHLAYLAEALAASRPALFSDYVAWAKVLLAEHGVPVEILADNLRAVSQVLRDRLAAEDAAAVCGYVDAALAALPGMAATIPSFIASNQPLTRLAEAYLKALLACQRQTASRMILDAVEGGTPIKDIYVHVFQQSQQEIGRLWQTNRITVAQEHYCTAATQMIMSQLYPRIFAGPRINRLFVAACVGGDLHEIGMRMVADFFEMDGWDTVFLGASVPGPDLIRTLQDRKPDVLGISVTLTAHVGAVRQMISDIRATPDCRNVKILVGGYPFLIVPDLWKQLDADGSCGDAQGAVHLANSLVASQGALRD